MSRREFQLRMGLTPISMRANDEQEAFDYVAFSGHKMYAPFGTGLLIGKAWPFGRSILDLPGGGTVDMVTHDNVIWADLPQRAVPGTPNLFGLLTMAVSASVLSQIPESRIIAHEKALVRKAEELCAMNSRIKLEGQASFSPSTDRLPIFPFTLDGFHHGLIAAVLAHEYGIAVRSGHLCQYEFMRRELGISVEEQERQEELIRAKDKSSMYGMVRASCGLCNKVADLEELGKALETILERGLALDYEQDRATGLFVPRVPTRQYFEALPPRLREFLGHEKEVMQ